MVSFAIDFVYTWGVERYERLRGTYLSAFQMATWIGVRITVQMPIQVVLLCPFADIFGSPCQRIRSRHFADQHRLHRF